MKQRAITYPNKISHRERKTECIHQYVLDQIQVKIMHFTKKNILFGSPMLKISKSFLLQKYWEVLQFSRCISLLFNTSTYAHHSLKHEIFQIVLPYFHLIICFRYRQSGAFLKPLMQLSQREYQMMSSSNSVSSQAHNRVSFVATWMYTVNLFDTSSELKLWRNLLHSWLNFKYGQTEAFHPNIIGIFE